VDDETCWGSARVFRVWEKRFDKRRQYHKIIHPLGSRKDTCAHDGRKEADAGVYRYLKSSLALGKEPVEGEPTNATRIRRTLHLRSSLQRWVDTTKYLRAQLRRHDGLTIRQGEEELLVLE
jgi:hypothetical protein